jgi:fructoselysine-6-P-deglycase FrlB-like protein
MLHHADGLTGVDRVLAISMSGNVDRTFEATQRAQAAGAAVALLTNGPGGRIAATGAARLSLEMPDLAPFLCGTASYTATLAALMLAFQPGAGAGLAGVIPGLPRLIGDASTLARRITAEIGCPPGVRWLGAGASVSTADYGAAKCVELARLPAWSDDIEEFAHRQYWAMATGELVVLLPGSPEAASYADATAEALSDIGTPTLALEAEGMAVPHARWRLALPGGAATAAIAQAIGLQPLVYHLALASGTDPDRRPHLREDAARFAVSRKLTRRSLLGTGQ